MIRLALIMLVAVAFAGCNKPSSYVSRSACSLKSGSKSIGGGVLVGSVDQNGRTNVAVVTARHVATYNWCYEIQYYRSGGLIFGGVHLPFAWDRWFTSNVENVDIAWLVLKEGEFPEREGLGWLPIDMMMQTGEPLPSEGSSVIIANAGRCESVVYCGENRDVKNNNLPFPNNRYFKELKGFVGGEIDSPTIVSESGSGIFIAKDGCSNPELVGIVFASNGDTKRTAFAWITNVVDDIKRTLNGGSAPRLINYPHLW